MASRAIAFRGQLVIVDEISIPLDQQLAAFRTTSIFQVPNLSGEVARINVAQSSVPPDSRCALQILRTSIGWGRQFVVLVKRSHVPRNVRRDASEECRKFA